MAKLDKIDTQWLIDHPIDKPNCPQCGSVHKIAETVAREMGIEEEFLCQAGLTYMGPQGQPMGLAFVLQAQSLSPKVLTLVQDVCAECGTTWVKKVLIKPAPLNMPLGFSPS